MDSTLELLKHPFSLGLLLGLLFFGLSFYAHLKTKLEYRRYRKILSDKLELESGQLESLKREREQLAKENENLRVKAAHTADLPQNKLERELELLARAEKHMMIQAPGFAPAWEHAKSVAHSELVAEERGNTLPKRIFRRFFGSTSTSEKEVSAELLPEPRNDGGDAAAADDESRAAENTSSSRTGG